MAPIYDTDVAEERWAKDEWRNYELWEKLEIRLRRRKRMWVWATIALFLVLSAVPVVMNRWSKWMALSVSRRLAQEINQLKRDAGIHRAAFRIRFADGGQLNYTVEKASSCADPKPVVFRSGALVDQAMLDQYALVSGSVGAELNLPGLLDSFCYDSRSGSEAALNGLGMVGFGISPVNDLAEKRGDRVALLLLSGPLAEMSFE